MIKEILPKLQAELDKNADKKYREKVRDYFKMDVANYLGVKIPLVRKIADKHFKEINHLDIDDVLKICNSLLETKIYEHKVIAFHWSYKCKNNYRTKHFKIFEGWLKTYVDDWSDCDDLCTHSLGYLVFKHPEFVPKVKQWSSSNNRWVKRASAVTLIFSARKGQHLDDVLDLASVLLLDKDDLVQKGYGWMLKEASKIFTEEVFEFVLKNKDKMPRTALRYAIEKMPSEYKKVVMKK
ncbi:MAG: hypothetical protein DHS20C13_07500 [Thermodesulfobacteriota bacterium]|nr:MAG: hypothetical protein DHS20C13_07500 [Thermodesulfobacteriota bacterium]